MSERHVLVVYPHPDDETLASGGTIALYTRDGVPVTYLCTTMGEMGRNMGRPFFATRESLPALREAELREACRILGVTDLRLMGIRDKTVEFVDPDHLARLVRAVVDDVQPSLVITYHPEHGVHPDHCALGHATVRALADIPADRRPVLHTRGFGKRLSEIGEPDITIDATPVMDIKMAATLAHRSQTESMFAEREAKAAKDPALRAEFEKQRTLEKYWIHRF